jgi:hypothetical protein
MKCPFPVGSTIFHKQWGDVTVVTAHTDKGFSYKGAPRTDIWVGQPVHFTGGGECYESGFDSWELYTGNNKVSRPLVSRRILISGTCTRKAFFAKWIDRIDRTPDAVYGFLCGLMVGALFTLFCVWLGHR